jgi:hypothetical protein
MYGTTSTAAGTTAAAGSLAFTGAHIASLIVLGLGLLFVGASLLRLAIKRRPYHP